MAVGSDLFNIIVTLGFLAFIGIIFYALFLLFHANKLKYELFRVKTLTCFHVNQPKNPPSKNNETPKDFRETLSVAEQFFSNLGSLYDRDVAKKVYDLQYQISLEIVASNGRLEFYCFCPKDIESMLERQINAFWPQAKVTKTKVPNIFNVENGAMASAELKLTKKFVLPFKTYKYLESDPMNALTNALTRMGEGSCAVIQLVVKPVSENWQIAGAVTAKKIQEGKSMISDKWYMKLLSSFFELLSGIFHGAKSEPENVALGPKMPKQLTPMQEQQLKLIQEKVAKTGLSSKIRLVTVAKTSQEAKTNLQNIIASFGQFSSPETNGFKVSSGDGRTIRDYILRRFTDKGIILNTEELASIYHLPTNYLETPNVNWLVAKEMMPPVNLPNEGVVLGESVFRGETKPVRIRDVDRRRHLFMIGKTGVGKTTLFLNMIEQDILAGRGACFIDPLGDAIEEILGKIPESRAKDVILFDPSDTDWPMGLNMLEYKTTDQRDFLIQEAIQIFYKLFDPGQTGIVGPQWEHWFRNAALTVMNQPDGGTLIDIPRIFTDDAFRSKLTAEVTDPIVKAFWTQQLAKTADFHKSEMYNYFISKFGRFMTNDLMRNIIGQKKSAFDLRQAMDEGKIILINLSKGKVGEVNSDLLGMILVTKMQMAAFSRADTPEENRKDFYLYVDEFQNFTTDSFATILSEARKYKLNLAITNQYIAQLTDKIRDAVIGNVGTIICYRIGAMDAEFMAKELPNVSEEDLTGLDTYNTYTKLLIDGTPTKPFSMRGIKPESVANPTVRENIKNLVRKSYCRPKSEVDAEIKRQLEVFSAAPSGVNEPLRNV